ncbi:molybdate ABC transporter substrate-binding protein [Nitrincola iocasae]|uniref:Molybdate ABC transporter substrate-binding protein n=1 Tax=Nitrincola iocasae TaxID=2614693 RepID=A0A5J6LHZ5_9GAMM|nr:molybdate ABC transporter substrate-binding protein [Nitrincola iocasae]QEW08257.1 molybdate ABC transporter substrate-binding protein [Nitrincola iocasae]
MIKHRWFQRVGLAGLLFLFCMATSVQILASVRVAAAADLQQALREIAEQFHQHYPQYSISLTFGSSGVFTSQLLQGAPFELFFSADAAYIDRLASEGLIMGQPYDYALGRIAFYSRQTLETDQADIAFQHWLDTRSDAAKLSIANPRHAPYGVAAMGWLTGLGKAEQVSSFRVLGENASQAVQFVLSGAAEAGVVAWPLLSGREDLPGRAWLIPESEHPPLTQRAALINNASQAAQAFFDYIQQPEAKQILMRHGFGLPD